MKLQQLTGLNDDSPLHQYLKIVDKFMGNHDWSYITSSSREKLFTKVSSIIGSFRDKIEEMQEDAILNELEFYLKQNKEKILLEIVQKLRRKNEISFTGIRCVLFWIIANIDLLAERYAEQGGRRQLNDDWQPAW